MFSLDTASKLIAVAQSETRKLHIFSIVDIFNGGEAVSCCTLSVTENISSLMWNPRIQTLSESNSSDEPDSLRVTWEDLFENYSSYKERLDGDARMVLSSIRVSSKDLGRVLAAEQAVAYRGGRAGLLVR